jgi:protein-S-isoprenylcysteine O-methyltransferase Ste14
MALVHSFETSGNKLFKYRGQIPALLFIAAIPAILLYNYDWLSPVYNFIFLGLSIFSCFLGFLIRAMAVGTTPKGTSGRNTEKQVAESLNHTGIYSVVRHPLYLGNFFIWFGIVIFTANVWFIIIFCLAFWIFYERIMFAEERFLEKKFGDRYLNWAKGVPAFFPNFRLYQKSEYGFSFKSILRREYSGFYATVVGLVYVDFLKQSTMAGEWIFKFSWLYVLVIAGFITLSLRSLKHYTNLLSEDDRS